MDFLKLKMVSLSVCVPGGVASVASLVMTVLTPVGFTQFLVAVGMARGIFVFGYWETPR